MVAFRKEDDNMKKIRKIIMTAVVLAMCLSIAACGKSVPKLPSIQAPVDAAPVEEQTQTPGGQGGLSPEIAKAYLAEVDELASHLGFSESEGLQDEYLHGGFISDWDGDGTPEMCLLLKTSPRENGGWDGTPLYGWNAPSFYLYRYINGQAARIAQCDLYFATAGREAEVAAVKTENGTQAVWFERNDTTGESFATCFELINGTIERKPAPDAMAELAGKAANSKAFFESLGEGNALPLLYNYSGEAKIEPAANGRELREALARTAGVTEELQVMKPAFDPDSWLGKYSDDGYNTVTIGKNGSEYTMEISIYRLTVFDEGTVTITDSGVIFDSTDGTGAPIRLSFYSTGSGLYAFRVEETTWPLLENGTVFDGLKKTE